MIRFYKFYFIILFISTALSACEIINPDEKIPGYIYIDSIIVKTNLGYQGSNSQNISDVWINIEDETENKLLGIYQLPAKFPVLKTGKIKI